MAGPLRIALLEDDPLLRDRILLPGLRNYGLDAVGMQTGAELEAAMRSRTFDILVLDVGLPDTDGFTVAREVRATHPHTGIVMLTCRHETPDRVRGLSEGADAYLAKPVEVELLAATLYSLARRLRAAAAPRTGVWRLEQGGWCLFAPSGAFVPLTDAERRLLSSLAARTGEVVGRDEIIAVLTDDVHDFDPHRLETLVYRLRQKVKKATGEALPLAAVHGKGYVLQIPA